MPMVLGLDTADEDRVFLFNELVELEVVHPYRPVPRSFYVLDDPGLSGEDRRLLSFLIDVWEANGDSVTIKERILTSLKTLGLVTHLSIHQIGQRQGPKVVEISVAPRLKRHAVSIADVGFGLSQVLPLVAYDANLVSGYLVAYQPEVHLHPFAQSRLADLFAASVRRGNQVFVETHSPDLILRLQALVAGQVIAPDDVRVFCLSNAKGESKFVSVVFDQHGSPAIPWPAGFLDTSLSLARELCARRLENGRG
jgi:predicted ATPase